MHHAITDGGCWLVMMLVWLRWFIVLVVDAGWWMIVMMEDGWLIMTVDEYDGWRHGSWVFDRNCHPYWGSLWSSHAALTLFGAQWIAYFHQLPRGFAHRAGPIAGWFPSQCSMIILVWFRGYMYVNMHPISGSERVKHSNHWCSPIIHICPINDSIAHPYDRPHESQPSISTTINYQPVYDA